MTNYDIKKDITYSISSFFIFFKHFLQNLYFIFAQTKKASAFHYNKRCGIEAAPC